MALQGKKVPLWIMGPNGGGLDTKSNPKMLGPGAVLEATNVDEFRPGEFRVRRGFAKLAGLGIGGSPVVGPIHQRSGGSLAATRPSNNALPWQFQVPEAYGGIALISGNYQQPVSVPAPLITATLKPVSATGSATFSPSDWMSVQDPDISKSGQFEKVSFVTASGGMDSRLLDTVTRNEINARFVPPGTNVAGRPILTCTTANYFVSIIVTAAGHINVFATANAATGVNFSYTSLDVSIGTGTVSVAQPWIDAIPAFGTDTVAVAFRASAGGVTTFSFGAATGFAVLGPTNIPTIDATMALGFVQDPAFVNSRYYLASAGATNGIVYHILTSGLALFSSTTLKATRTTGVRQVTGYMDAAALTVRVLFDVAGTTAPEDCTLLASSAFPGTEFMVATGYCLNSKPGKCNGNWVVVCAFTSLIGQSHYGVFMPVGSQTLPGTPMPTLGLFMFGEGAGRRPQSSLSNAITGTLSSETGKLYVAVTRRRSIQTPAGTAQQQLQVQTVELTDITATAPQSRELGGTFFVPGALMLADDGVRTGYAVLPTAPEIVTAPAGSAGGGLTALGTYSYRFVWKRLDASGRVLRSASCPAQSYTLIAGQGTIVTKVAPPAWIATEEQSVILEGYRQGPAASGASGYNLVGTVSCSPYLGGTTSFIDLMTDAVAITQEYAYFNGNVLENFAPPGHAIMEVGNGRAWVVNSEYPTEVWYSKEYKPGAGLGFNPQNTFRIEGDGRGAIVGIANLDGRMVFFKDTSIWIVSGDGPNDLGQGSFSQPQAISLNVGCLTRASIVRTPDGVLFQANTGGVWMLGRDLGLSPLGMPVDGYLIPVTASAATPVVGASLVSAAPQVRMCLASGRVLVFNYLTKRWTTYVVPVAASTIVSCVDTTLYGWCYELADGSIYQESQAALTDDGGATITPTISFPHLQLSGLNGYERFRGLDIAVDVVGNHTLAMDAEYDFSGAVTGTPKTIALTTATPTAQVEYTPPEGRAKCSAVRPVLTIQGAAAGSSFRLVGAVATLGVKKGSNIPASSRLT